MDRFIPVTIPIAPRFPSQVRGEQSLYQLFCFLIGTIKGFTCLKSCKNWHAMKHLSALFRAALSEEALPLRCGQRPGFSSSILLEAACVSGGFGGSTTHTWPTCTLLRLHSNGHEPLASSCVPLAPVEEGPQPASTLVQLKQRPVQMWSLHLGD